MFIWIGIDVDNQLLNIKEYALKIDKKLESLGSDYKDEELTNRYEAELKSIIASKEKLEGMV